MLDWSASEIATLLDTTTSSVNSALHRARVTLSKSYRGQKAPAIDKETDEQTRETLEKYIQAWQTADENGLVALLKKDATLSMPPSPSWYAGRENIGLFATGTVFANDGMFPGLAKGRSNHLLH